MIGVCVLIAGGETNKKIASNEGVKSEQSREERGMMG